MPIYGIGFRNTVNTISSKRRIGEFIVYETLIKVGTDLIWLWILLI
ncbi:MAG TPA: hypothetical protein VN704_05025 [Verrucomicrobiae bacterium]|nr:hypothetical protein [Verrucomicrobiae bacterium]